MRIKRIEVSNFKSFKKLGVELGDFNVLIGANASGKSNFVQIFKMLRDIAKFGLSDAISIQGDVEYLRNLCMKSEETMFIGVHTDEEFGVTKKIRGGPRIGIKVLKSAYEFELTFAELDKGFMISRDNLTHECEFVELGIKGWKEKEKKKYGESRYVISNSEGKLTGKIRIPEGIAVKEKDLPFPFLFPPFLPEGLESLRELRPWKIMLETPFFPLLAGPLGIFLIDMSVYDFDPKLPKKGTPITGKAKLEEDGCNLSIVLKNLIQKTDDKRKLFNYVKDLLPFVSDLDVDRLAEKSLLFKLRETYFGNQYLPASFISDGTINIIALMVALYFEKTPVTIIEEPERNIHPYLISKVIEMMKDASRKKQIIVTTHNPEVVKYAGLGNILIVSRDRDGFTTISRPKDKKEIAVFLEEQIGIEELYVQNLLGGQS
jgi:predicted ATPase